MPQATPKTDVLAVGNAIVDTLARVDDDVLAGLNLTKGNMTLVDETQSAAIFDAMGQVTKQSGGSGANTIAGLASLGAKCAFIGKVASDDDGTTFIHDMKALGVDTYVSNTQHSPATARCMVLVTPDGERTMATFLGISTQLTDNDLSADAIKNAKITYLEGYLYDDPAAKAAYDRAAKIAKDADRRVALTLSDGFCVDRHRDDFRKLVSREVDILFANKDEILSLYQASDLEAAITQLKQDCPIAAVTLGAEGARILHHGEDIIVPAQPLNRLVDTTGAGDLFASGFLYGLTQDMPAAQAGILGTKTAAAILGHVGARPERPLRDLLTNEAA